MVRNERYTLTFGDYYFSGVAAHFNWPIEPGTGASAFDFKLRVEISDELGHGTQAYNFQFTLNIEETPNYCAPGACPWEDPSSWAGGENPRCVLWTETEYDATACMARGIDGDINRVCCKYQSKPGVPCSDKIYPSSTLDLSAPPITLGGSQYTLRIEGFRAPGSDSITEFFLSDEEQNTIQYLYARIVPYCAADVKGLCGTQPNDTCAQRSCDMNGFCSLAPKPAMLGQPCTPAAGSPVAPLCSTYRCMPDYVFGATCDLVVDPIALGQPCVPSGNPNAPICQEYRCMVTTTNGSSAASCIPTPWAQPIPDPRCLAMTTGVACEYQTCSGGQCVSSCAEFDEVRCPVGIRADSSGQQPAFCFRRGCSGNSTSTLAACSCLSDVPFPEDARCPLYSPLPKLNTPQDAACNKYECAANGCTLKGSLTCNGYHPWNLSSVEPSYDPQCWAPKCVSYPFDVPPSGFPSGSQYGRCEVHLFFFFF